MASRPPDAATRSDVDIAKACFEWAGKLSELTLDKREEWGRTIINTLSVEGRDHTIALLKVAGDALLRKDAEPNGY